MKISKIEIFPLHIPLRASFRNSRQARDHQESIVLKIETDERFYGVGNVDPDPGYSEQSFPETLAVIAKLSQSIHGLDPFNIVAVLEHMDQVLSGHLEAKAALEIALFDLKGRAMKVPVYSLLGGKLRDVLDLNGWIGMLPPDEAARDAQEWLKHGFGSAKIKVGSGVEEDRDRVKAVREVVGKKMTLRVDANEAYNVNDAIKLGKALQPFDLALFEQPVARRDLKGMAQVRKKIEIPIMADESILGPETLNEVIKNAAADMVKLKVMKQGGIHRTVQMAGMAEAAGLKCVIGHGFGLAINTLAEIHVAASCKNFISGCEFVGPLKIKKDVVKQSLIMDAGKVRVPDDSGLGAELDEEKLKDCIRA